MNVWPFIVIMVLAPFAVGGLFQLASGALSPVLVIVLLAWLGIAGALKRIVGGRRPANGKHVRDV